MGLSTHPSSSILRTSILSLPSFNQSGKMEKFSVTVPLDNPIFSGFETKVIPPGKEFDYTVPQALFWASEDYECRHGTGIFGSL